MKLRKRKKRNKYVIIFMVFLVTFWILNNINNKLVPYIEKVVEKYVKRDVYNYVFYIFDKEILTSEELGNIVNLNMNKQGEVVSVDYKFNIAYKYLSDGMNDLYDNVKNIKLDTDYYDKNKSLFFIPSGIVTGNYLLENFGFKIPCKINFLSDIDMSFKTKVKDYGMNNLLVELYLVINVKNDMISPSSFYEFGESYEMIIASEVVVGKIPVYYGNELEKSSAIVSS